MGVRKSMPKAVGGPWPRKRRASAGGCQFSWRASRRLLQSKVRERMLEQRLAAWSAATARRPLCATCSDGPITVATVGLVQKHFRHILGKPEGHVVLPVGMRAISAADNPSIVGRQPQVISCFSSRSRLDRVTFTNTERHGQALVFLVKSATRCTIAQGVL